MASTMTKVSMRNIAAHKLRLFLTVVAVVLGTAFIAGSLMFTAMLERTFDSAVASRYESIDAVIQAGADGTAVTRETLAVVERDPMVARVNEGGATVVVAADSSGEAIQTGQGVSRISVYYPADESVGNSPQITQGRAPLAVGEVLLNGNAAEKYAVSLDEELIVVDAHGRHDVRVVGFYDDGLAQPMSLSFETTPTTYAEFYTDGTTVPQVSVAAAGEVSPQQLVDALRLSHPKLTIETGETLAEEASEQIREGLSFVSYFLIAFGLVGLLVGTFLIANTFSMIVAQRTKEFALLRALGASRGQITRSVSVEAFIVGLVGSVVGVGAGAGLVTVIKAVMSANDMSLPTGGLGLSAKSVVVPVVVGVLVTLASAWAPARKAGQVQPVEAMRASETVAPKPLRGRTVAGAVLIVAGLVASAAGMGWSTGATSDRAIMVGAAAVALIGGLFLAGPALSLPVVPPVGRVIGAPFGAVGKLASTNTRRNPRRTSATAFALMLGIALVTVIGMLGATMKQSVSDIVDSQVSADYVLSGPQMGAFPVPASVLEKVAAVDGVGAVVSYSEAPVTVDGEYSYTFGPYGASPVFSGNPAELFAIEMLEGESDLSADRIIVPRFVAEEKGWKVGDTATVGAPGLSPGSVEVTVGGIFADSDVIKGVALGQETALKVVPETALTIQAAGVRGDGSVDVDKLRGGIENAVRDEIVVQVKTAQEMNGEVSAMIDQMLCILYALLSLAVVIAVLGIVNTLTLSVIERRQEIGMLRAVGTHRRQVRVMIILESVQMAAFGAFTGTLTGLGLGWAFLTVLESQGLKVVVVPWPLLGIMLAGSILVGILAALWPAHKAAATPPLDAIAE
ncbi:ABC transporter permease [Corynebacterium mayonis]|uniref:ABC transporter permease n=1 Tax=Corynebacterium mayonis TaxID=3062461 RepID=UPI00314051DD